MASRSELDRTSLNEAVKENYALRIYEASGHDRRTIPAFERLVRVVKEIYRYIEPGHYSGTLIVYVNLTENEDLDETLGEELISKNILMTKLSSNIVIKQKSDDTLIMWEGVDVDTVSGYNDVLVYKYKNKKEWFIANGQQIEVINRYKSASVYALQYHDLHDALEVYEVERVLNSSCEKLNECWFDKSRIFLKSKPEKTMQISLKEFLSSTLRGVEVVREYNLGASKPVDVRVYWKESNRAALIELKWLGQSKNQTGKLSKNWTNSRARDGMNQIKEYIDLCARDTPSTNAKGFLVVIDARRSVPDKKVKIILEKDGYKYRGTELNIPDSSRFHETVHNIEKPLRMFVNPICS